MKVNIKLNDNFYKEFGNVSDEVLEYAFNKLTERNMIKVYIYYGERSKEKKMGTKKAMEVKSNIRRVLYKKCLYNYLNTSTDNINNLINTLKPFEREYLLKEYSLNSDDIIEVLTSEEVDRNKKTIQKLKSAVNVNRFNLTRKKSPENYKGFFNQFDKPVNEVIRVINTLPERDINLLKLKLGNDYKELNVIDTVINQEINSRIVVRIKRYFSYLDNGAEYVTIRDFVNDTNDIDTIKLRVESLNEKQKKLIYKFFKDDLSKEHITADKEGLINKQIIRKLNLYIDKRRTKEFKSFYSQLVDLKLDSETIGEFNERINTSLTYLSNEEKSLLYKKYHSDFMNSLNYGQVTKEENFQIIHTIIPKLRWYIKKQVKPRKEGKHVFDRFIESESIILEYINKLSEEEKNTLKLKYGENYDKVNDVSHELNREVRKNILRIERDIVSDLKKENNIDAKVSSLMRTRFILKSEEFKKLSSIYGVNESMLLLCLIKYPEYITFDEIYNITGLNKEELLNVTKKYIRAHK